MINKEVEIDLRRDFVHTALYSIVIYCSTVRELHRSQLKAQTVWSHHKPVFWAYHTVGLSADKKENTWTTRHAKNLGYCMHNLVPK